MNKDLQEPDDKDYLEKIQIEENVLESLADSSQEKENVENTSVVESPVHVENEEDSKLKSDRWQKLDIEENAVESLVDDKHEKDSVEKNVGFSSPIHVENEEDSELKTVRSWIYMITFMLTSLLLWGTVATFPLLFVEFIERFQGTRSETAFIGSLQVGLLYFLAIIPGYIIPVLGYKIVVILGAIITSTGFILSIFVTEMHYLYITMGIITSLGSSFTMTAVDTVPLVLFKKRRALANILNLSCGSAGFTVMPLLTGYLLREYGLDGALLLMAGVMLQGVVLGMLYPFYYKGDTSFSSEIDGRKKKMTCAQQSIKSMKSASFWLVAAGAMALDSLSNGCRVFLLDRAILEGISKSDAIFAFSFWGIVSALTKPFIQLPCINRSPDSRQVTWAITTFGWAAVTVASIGMKTFEGFLAYCILAGAHHGVMTSLWYLSLADVMDRELLVTAYGLQCVIASPFVTFSAPAAGWIYDTTKSYDNSYIIYGCLGVFGGICISFIPFVERRKRHRKRLNHHVSSDEAEFKLASTSVS